ncbi:uncharacterized protein YjbI with pentapeptide repeats [Actinokineospora auranticolor]|uniref:Uncharacterized protein YjbI with pentapeptide repeats n=2 Tax=Actinokineospora auranticolor TaxID=155976 RepID=A0A2S6GRN8_9PSEU|nr:uncharacterized protein YjbI with pentapeptide repeats [Actinokineospora auranticolor]
MPPPTTRVVVIAVVGVVVVVGGLLTLLWLLVDGGSPQASAQLELARIGMTVLLGTGGLFGLYLAWRRQRSAEIGLAQKERDQADVARAYELQRGNFEATQRDAEARRITDLYTKAADQLGSDKAPVRLAGLYALERLAQDHDDQRQTVVNVLCAYLRMPYTPPGDAPPDTDGLDSAVRKQLLDEYREAVQEREVRVTAQRILATHLRPGPDPDNPDVTFWRDIDLDLTAATLTDLDLAGCCVRTASFLRSTFIGIAGFRAATFDGGADFGEAMFGGGANFRRASFGDDAVFMAVRFTVGADFGEATFSGGAVFREATFSDGAVFGLAMFTGRAYFREATFGGGAHFAMATFGSAADFGVTKFDGTADFGAARFAGSVDFQSAGFAAVAIFRGAALPDTRYGLYTPDPWADFEGARFEQGVPPELARFVAPSEDG